MASIYYPTEAREEQIPERLGALAKTRRRSVNFLIVDAIREYLAREENKETP